MHMCMKTDFVYLICESETSITCYQMHSHKIEAATEGVLGKKVFLKISENSQKRPVLDSIF